MPPLPVKPPALAGAGSRGNAEESVAAEVSGVCQRKAKGAQAWRLEQTEVNCVKAAPAVNSTSRSPAKVVAHASWTFAGEQRKRKIASLAPSAHSREVSIGPLLGTLPILASLTVGLVARQQRSGTLGLPSPELTAATCCRLTPRLPRRHPWGWQPRPCCSNVVSATAATERRADDWAGCAHAEHYGGAGGGQHSEDELGPGGPGQGGPRCLLHAAM